jgi:hypothetical protein
MKQLATVMFASLATVAFAGQPVMETSKKTVIPEEPCFGETELQLDVYGAYAGTYGDKHADGWGGGIGINYYFSRYIGLGVDGTVTDGEGSELWHIHGHVLARWPIDTGSICLAPYIKAGGGYQVNGSGDWSYGVGGGIEVRVTPRWGVFGEGGYYWAESDENYAQAKAGVRFIF